MSSLLQSLDFTAGGLLASTFWLRVANVACLFGAAFAVASALRHRAMHRRAKGVVVADDVLDDSSTAKPVTPAVGGNPIQKLAMGALYAGIALMGWSIWQRYLEVNHFPSQTMSEVLVMFAWTLLISMAVLHYALKLGREGLGWAIVDDALLVLVFLGTVFTNHYATTLSTAQRDLPPALQSYWFPPHLAALIFSYATLGIAGLMAIIYFTMRFWAGIYRGGWSVKSQLLILAGLLVIPFIQVVTIPILLAVGMVFLMLKMRGTLPSKEDLGSLEKTMDQVSYKAFSVGIPFLTAGLFMGAFWAQEAWANYWGWDSKENSALITWLVYVVYIHLRMLGGYRGEKAMAVLAGGALSVFLTFQIFGYLPDSQKSLHRYTDDGVTPREGMQGARAEASDDSARLEVPDDK